jgi:RNA polymerase sigma-70 factor (ECF subfamily)
MPIGGRGETARRADGQLADLVRAHVAALRRYARLLIGDPTEADVKDPRAYLFAILHNTHVSRRRRARLPEVPLESAISVSVPAAQPDRLALRDLARAFARLSDEHREVLLLIGVEGLTYREAALVLNVPIGTVMSRLSRGREALRRMLAEDPVRPMRLVKDDDRDLG